MPVVLWYPYIGVCYLDKQPLELPVCTHLSSGWLLLQQIKQMPRKRPISVQDAWRMMLREIHLQMSLQNNEPHIPGHSNWIRANKILWLTRQGYHVELTGNEFEYLDQAEQAA